MFLRFALMLLLLLASAGAAFAQTGAIIAYEMEFYQPGVDPTTGGQPFASVTIPPSAVTCAPGVIEAPTPVVNPTYAAWDGAPGERCRADQSAFLLAVPIGGPYLATLIAVNDLKLDSARSAPSNPFSRVGAPGVRTGLRLSR